VADRHWGARVEVKSGERLGTLKVVVNGVDLSDVTQEVQISCVCDSVPRATITFACEHLEIDQEALLRLRAQLQDGATLFAEGQPEG
jgi:hypothetical protein